MYDALHQDVASQASMYNTWFHGHWIMPCTHIYIHVTTSSIHLSLTDSNRVWANATPLEIYFFFLADLCQAALGWCESGHSNENKKQKVSVWLKVSSVGGNALQVTRVT